MNTPDRNTKGWMVYMAEFYFGLSKIRSKGTLYHSQIAQLLSKWENMAEKL